MSKFAWLGIVLALPLASVAASLAEYRVRKYEMCRTKENTMARYKKDTMQLMGGKEKFVLNGSVELVSNVPGPISVEVNSTRCNDKREVCRFFKPFYWDDLCLQLLFRTFEVFKMATPAINKCPIKKGIYRFNQLPIDMSAYSEALNGWYWQTRLQFFSGEDRNREIVFCIDYEWSMRGGGNRRRTKSTTKKFVKKPIKP